MSIQWTKSARTRLLPYPGDEWRVATNLHESERAITASTGPIPATLTLESEIQRGVAARLDERYGVDGNHPTDKLGHDLVDLWCARRDVVFATEVLIAIVRTRPVEALTVTHKPYELRRDGRPWGRLREHLFAGAPERLAQARTLAAAARSSPVGELRPALAYAFCEREWVDEDLDEALGQGYGQLALLACLTETARIAEGIERVLETLFQLIEEAVPHVPNVMSRLGDDGAPLIMSCAGLAWDEASREPWIDLVRCYDTPEALAFLAQCTPE